MVNNEENKGLGQETPNIKKNKTFWDKFITFLSMGGFLVILIVIVAIVIAVSTLASRC
jgi:hypothetical protein